MRRTVYGVDQNMTLHVIPLGDWTPLREAWAWGYVEPDSEEQAHEVRSWWPADRLPPGWKWVD